ncbi:hypothetical protein PSE_2485 [Pseudovibrio sp. FO-BEG1]|nr:hypothetical protein PSE_2485 [Pseudovibrio sp. FO-BEG1]
MQMLMVAPNSICIFLSFPFIVRKTTNALLWEMKK